MFLDINSQEFDYDRDFIPFIKNGVIIDTSVLKIMLEGIVSSRISKRPSIELNKLSDYLDYVNLKNKWGKFFITPHILTELCHHLRNKYNSQRNYKKIIEEVIPIIKEIDEKNVKKDEIISYIDLKNPVIEIGDISIFSITDDLIKKNEKIAILVKDYDISGRYAYDRNVLILDYNTIINYIS